MVHDTSSDTSLRVYEIQIPYLSLFTSRPARLVTKDHTALPTMTFTPVHQPAPDDLRIRNVTTCTVFPSGKDPMHPLSGQSVPLSGQDLAMPDIYMGTCLFFLASRGSPINTLVSVDEVMDSLTAGFQRLASQFPAVSSHFSQVDGVWNIQYTSDGFPVTLATSDRDLGDGYIGRGGRIDSDVLPRSFNVVDHSDPAFAVKVTRFACGSIALGTSVHHWLCDYAGYHDIMVNLALALSQSADLPPRDYSRNLRRLIRDVPSELIPIRDWFVQQSGGKVWESGEFALLPDSVTNVMLYFPPESLLRLKFDTIRSMQTTEDWVSTNDTLAALLWSSLTAARGLKGPGPSKAVLTVDGRRFVPSSESYVGNVHTLHSSTTPLDILCANTPLSVLQVAQTLRGDLRRLSRGKMAAIIRLQDADLTSSFMPNYKPFFGHDVLISNLTKYDWSSLKFGKLGAPAYVSVITSAPVQAGPFKIEGSEGSIFIQNAPVASFLQQQVNLQAPVSFEPELTESDYGTSKKVGEGAQLREGAQLSTSLSISKPGVIAIVGIRECDVNTFTTLPLLSQYATVLP